MTLEDPRKKSEKSSLKVLRGGVFDETKLIRRMEKFLVRVKYSDNENFLKSVYNRCEEILKNEDLKEKEREIVEEVLTEVAKRLFDLEYSFEKEMQEEKDIEKTEKLNV